MKIQEINVVRKVNYNNKYIKFALCYPNVYRAGISNFAVQLIYRLLNDVPDIACERYFYDHSGKPVSIENNLSLKSFDVIGFSLQYELDYFNVINILKAANIPIYAKNRRRPLLVAGGPCVLENPVPLNEIFDLFVIGDIEPVFEQFISLIENYVQSESKNFIKFKSDGFYFPNIIEETIRKTTTHNLDTSYHPLKQVIPIKYDENRALGLGKTILVECSRGCKAKCYFCLIGWQNNPYRERSKSRILEIIEGASTVNNVKKVSLIGSGISFHKNLNDIVWGIVNLGLQVSIPSLRADKFGKDLAEALKAAKMEQVTFAPETGSDELRKRINKNMKNDDILDAVQNAISANINKIKLYFMLDLPTENNTDLIAIAELIKEIINVGVNKNNLSISINNFIPKPHTPFQWYEISDIKSIRNKIKLLSKIITKEMNIRINFSDPKWDRIQTLLSRGDEQIGKLIQKTYTYGSNLGSIRRILKEMNTSIDNFNKEISVDQKLPWDFIDCGIKKNIIIKIWEKTKRLML